MVHVCGYYAVLYIIVHIHKTCIVALCVYIFNVHVICMRCICVHELAPLWLLIISPIDLFWLQLQAGEVVYSRMDCT